MNIKNLFKDIDEPFFEDSLEEQFDEMVNETVAQPEKEEHKPSRLSLHFQENRFLWMTFFATALIVLITYALYRIYPFGDQIILKIDMYHQYAPFHEELRSRLLNGQSLFYSWEGALGKELFTQIAYYSASPLSILMLLFTTDTLPEAMAFLILLKIAISGVTFAYYCKKSFGRNDWSLLIFGLFYASCSFIVSYHWNVMWLDAVYLFPLVALGIERLIKEGKTGLYIVSLALTIFTNFYIAFLVCVLSVFYFAMMLLIQGGFRGNWKRMFDRIWRFGVVSLLAGGICMVLVIPTYIGLSQTAVADTTFPKFEIYTNIWQILENHFIGARTVVLGRNQDLPNIYCGLLPVMLVPFYYLDRNYKVREKITYSLFLLFLLACSVLKQLDFLIHGLHWPANLPHRYTFVYSFILLVLAYKAFLHLKEANWRWIPVVIAVDAAILFVSEFVVVPRINGISRVYDNLDLVLNVVGFVFYGLILAHYMRHKRIRKEWIAEALLVLVMAECIFSQVNGLERTTSRNSYLQYNEGTRNAIDWMDLNADGDFYRTEFTKYTIINEGSYHHYNGVSQFSSLAPEGISLLMGKLGTSATGNSYRLGETTPVLDAMLSLRYRMLKTSQNAEEKELPFMTYQVQFQNVAVYKNKRVLPLGYRVSADLLDWNSTSGSPFTVQNDYMAKATGNETPIFANLKPVDIEAIGVTTSGSGSNSFTYKVDDPADLDTIPTVKVHLESDRDQYLYLYVKAGNANTVQILQNGEETSKSISTGNSILDIGPVAAGDQIVLTFELTDKGEFELQYRSSGTVTVYAAGYRDEVFDQDYETLMEEPWMISSFEDTRIEGTIVANEEGLLITSIPYCLGWSVTVDGEAKDLATIGDGFIGVLVDAGEHQVVFSYEVPGLKEGSVISVLSLMITIIYLILEKKKPANTEWVEWIPKRKKEDLDKEASLDYDEKAL